MSIVKSSRVLAPQYDLDQSAGRSVLLIRITSANAIWLGIQRILKPGLTRVAWPKQSVPTGKLNFVSNDGVGSGRVPAFASLRRASRALALQLHSPFEMGAARFGLMGSSPERPCDDVRGLDAPLCKLDDDAADFLDRPADQERCFVRRRSIIFLGGDVILARCRMTAIMAKASMTSET